jgi:hypothetical protein
MSDEAKIPTIASEASVPPEIAQQAVALLEIAAEAHVPAETSVPLAIANQIELAIEQEIGAPFGIVEQPAEPSALIDAEPAGQSAPSGLETALEKPHNAAKRQTATGLSITAISFSLTFVLASVALLMGFIPATTRSIVLPVDIDIGVVLLTVPLCALVLAMLLEAIRAAVKGMPRSVPRPAITLSQWRPGTGEG